MMLFTVESGQTGYLAACRQQLAREMPSQALILAVNEIVANILRHTQPGATRIAIEFSPDRSECRIIDNGGPFHDFEKLWAQASGIPGMRMVDCPHMGLAIVRRLYPLAYYRSGIPYNVFVLPLGDAS